MKIVQLKGSREDKAQELAQVFEGIFSEDAAKAKPSFIRGGRKQSLETLAAFKVKGYAGRRNHVLPVETNVSRLSPYIRHGILSLREVAESVRERFGSSYDASKFWAELGWRQFWQLVYRGYGSAIYENIEEPKVALGQKALPPDIAQGKTGLVCMDESIGELLETGMMHNHARMWVASYVVHGRKVDWRAGERWFYQHLLDGDPASNALSWQWVASTFSSKPYIFNQENVQKYAGNHFCSRCTAVCPFEGTYEELNDKWFGVNAQPPISATPNKLAIRRSLSQPHVVRTPVKTLVWLHGDSLSEHDPALQNYVGSERVFIFDRDLLRKLQLSFKRLFFLYESAVEVTGTILFGSPVEEILRLVKAEGYERVAVTESVSPRFQEMVAELRQQVDVEVIEKRELVSVPDDYVPKRFMQFWKKYGQAWA